MAEVLFRSKRTFEIVKGDTKITLNEEDMRALLQERDVQQLLSELEEQVVKPAPQLEKHEPTQLSLEAMFGVKLSFPPGFMETFRSPADKRASHKNIFVYAYNSTTREYGFKIVNDRGEVSTFYRLGAIESPQSVIGSFLREIKKVDKPLIKRRFLEIGLTNVTEGRRLKALIDIAEHHGFLKKTALEGRAKGTSYQVTEKVHELGGETGWP